MTEFEEVRPPRPTGDKLGAAATFSMSSAWLLILACLCAAQPARAQQPFPARDQLLSRIGADVVHDLRYTFRETDHLVYPTFEGFTGVGVRIGIFDEGINESHPDFGPWRMHGRGERRFYTAEDANGSKPHGTHVAAIAAAEGAVNWQHGLPTFSLRGVAPHAQLGDFQRISTSEGYNVAPYILSVLTHDTDVSNHSYEEAEYRFYGDFSARLDELIAGAARHADGTPVPARPMVWAAGNGAFGTTDDFIGYYSLQSLSKNAISVGSVDARTGVTSKSTALGPTPDGRLKPDLVAPGCHESWAAHGHVPRPAANGSTYDFQTIECGTSMAAPVVTGVIALMMDRFNSMAPSGLKPSAALRPSTYKALLIHTAKDLSMLEPSNMILNDTGESIRYHAGPDYATGYGMVDAAAAVGTVAQLQRWKEGVFDPSCGGDGAACTQSWHIWAPDGSPRVKVVLAWDDPPGSPQQSMVGRRFKPFGRSSCAGGENVPSTLVNDIDLKLIMPNSERTSIEPWIVPPPCQDRSTGRQVIAADSVRQARRGEDDVNNVEMASYPEPPGGWWRVDVTMNEPPPEPQFYSLVSSHAFLPCQPAEPPDDAAFPQASPECAPPDERWLRYSTEYGGNWVLNDGAKLPIDVACRMTQSCDAIRRSEFIVRSRLLEAPTSHELNIVVVDAQGNEIKRLPLHAYSWTQLIVPQAGERLFLSVVDAQGEAIDPVRVELSFLSR